MYLNLPNLVCVLGLLYDKVLFSSHIACGMYSIIHNKRNCHAFPNIVVIMNVMMNYMYLSLSLSVLSFFSVDLNLWNTESTH